MSPSIWQILIIAVVVLILFGRGRISEMMGDFGKGIKSFKNGMSEDERASADSKARIEAPAPSPSETTESTTTDTKSS